MFKSFYKYLNKFISNQSQRLTDKQNYTREQVVTLLAQLQSNIKQSLSEVTQKYDKQMSSLKSQFKSKNKALNEANFLLKQQKKNWQRQKEQMEEESQNHKKKIQQFIKQSEKYQRSIQKPNELTNMKKNKKFTDSQTQCNILDKIYEQEKQAMEKQNIFLNQRVIKLQQILEEKQELIEAANYLIQDLVNQISTNTSDRVTNRLRSNSSQNSSASDYVTDSDRESQLHQNEAQEEQKDSNQEEYISSTCSQINPEECSTVAGSCSSISSEGNPDFALPQWLQFNESPIGTGLQVRELQDEEKKMWLELLWNRLKKFAGFNTNI